MDSGAGIARTRGVASDMGSTLPADAKTREYLMRLVFHTGKKCAVWTGTRQERRGSPDPSLFRCLFAGHCSVDAEVGGTCLKRRCASLQALPQAPGWVMSLSLVSALSMPRRQASTERSPDPDRPRPFPVREIGIRIRLQRAGRKMRRRCHFITQVSAYLCRTV
jgi:hypothetical protein